MNNGSKCKVSIIMPSLNVVNYIDECIQSALEQTLDDIEFSDKSAAKLQIEKFVDENPEAVAALLRNWLNDDWE